MTRIFWPSVGHEPSMLAAALLILAWLGELDADDSH
jgi:hypothetical protein